MGAVARLSTFLLLAAWFLVLLWMLLGRLS